MKPIAPNHLVGFGGYLSHFVKSSNPLINVTKPTKLVLDHLKQNVEFTRVAAGSSHALVGFRDSQSAGVVALGSNTSGQLGLGTVGESYHSGTVPDLSATEVVTLSAGREHGAALVSDKNGTPRLYTAGNAMLGQLGLGISKNYAKGPDTDNHFKWVDKFTEVVLDFRVKDVQCGLDHTVILSDAGDIYTCGWGSDGQLGLGEGLTADASTFHKVDIPNGEKVVQFSTRHDCTIVLTDRGTLYSWGNSEYGQAGHGRKIDRILAPMRVPFDRQVVALAAGGNFSLLLTVDGEVFVWGCGSLGLGAVMTEALTPTPIKSLKRATRIFAGGNSAAVLDDNNSLFTWGIGSPLFSRLGFDHHTSVFAPTKVDIDPSLKIVDVAMGWHFGLAITQDS